MTRIRKVTSVTDWILFAMLLIQTVSGVAIALFHPWGSSWFATNMSPYLWSIFKLNPDISFITAMPHLVKLHIVLAFLTIGFFPVHSTGALAGDSQSLPVAQDAGCSVVWTALGRVWRSR